MNRFRPMQRMVLALGLWSAASCALAVSECQVTPERYFVGDNILYVSWAGGGVGVIDQADPDFKPTLAAVMASLLAQKTLIVRYAENGANCNGTTAYNIIGIWLVK